MHSQKPGPQIGRRTDRTGHLSRYVVQFQVQKDVPANGRDFADCSRAISAVKRQPDLEPANFTDQPGSHFDSPAQIRRIKCNTDVFNWNHFCISLVGVTSTYLEGAL